MVFGKGLYRNNHKIMTSSSGDGMVSKERNYPGRLFLPTLAFSGFAISTLGIVTALLLIDMAETFHTSVGIMGQINTPSSIASFIFALMMGVLSVRFRHRSLLLAGLLLMFISALGCALAPNLSSIFILYALGGIGGIMVVPMSLTLVGDYVPFEKRASAIGWVNAGQPLAYLIGAPLIAFIAGFGGWRSAIWGFVLPISLVGLLLAFKGLRSISKSGGSNENYLEGFRAILSNSSAKACLTGNALRSIQWMAILIYGISFFRQKFGASPGFASIVLLGAAFFYTAGNIIGGGVVNRLGRKLSSVVSALLAGIFTISYAFISSLWLSLALNLSACLFSGMVVSASVSLTIEQVPRFRGTIMSVNSAAASLGSAIGASAGGFALLHFDYEGLGTILGTAGILAAIVYKFYTIDPSEK
jgi:DHA1 family inner membrane transport protein